MTLSNSIHILAMPVLSLLAISGCAHSGTKPDDMSVSQHEAAAVREGQQASQGVVGAPCQDGRVCWSDADAASMAKPRELAARHRAAAKTLQDAEARACTGLRDEDRDTSPFSHGADIRSVSRLEEDPNSRSPFAGATVVFRPVQGLTAEWLQRIINCHLARNASVGHDMPEMPECPLVLRNVSATVRSTGDGFAVDIRASDNATAAEIWRRAQMIHIKR